MTCHHCGSDDYRKNGSFEGTQRFICRSCGRSFTSRGHRIARSVKEQALDMHLNNVGVRKTARFVKASPASVINWIRAAGKRLAAQLRDAADQVAETMPDVIEMDEIYTFVQKNNAGPLSGLLIVGGKVVLLRIPSEKD